MIELSPAISQLTPSPTLALNSKAKAMQQAGIDIINLTAGEPDFDPPASIIQAAINAIESGHHKYTAVDGTAELKRAIIKKLIRDNRLEYKPEEIIVSNGAKHSIYNLLRTIICPGDEVIIPAPYWVSYPTMVQLVGGKPVILSTQQQHQFNIQQAELEAVITDKTKAIFLNSPNNPTGQCYDVNTLKMIASVLEKHPEILIITDDIYEYLTWDTDFTNIVSTCPELFNRTFVINGVSKSHCMTGWRIGYTAGPADAIKGMKKLQSQSTSNPNAIAQQAAITALNIDRHQLRDMYHVFQHRQVKLCQALNQIDGFECLPAQGAFYLFPNISQAMTAAGFQNDIDFAAHLLEHARVASVPGSAFGAPGFLRLSCAIAEEKLSLAATRIEQSLSKKTRTEKS